MSRAYYGNVNYFGGPSSTAVKASAKLKQLEEENEDAMFCVRVRRVAGQCGGSGEDTNHVLRSSDSSNTF